MTHEMTYRFKGLDGVSRRANEIQANDKTIGPYYRWWRLMQLSRVFWFAQAYRCPIADEQVANTFNLMGDIHNQSFDSWWMQTGQQIFSEIDEFAKVREIDLATFTQADRYKRSVIIEVPLTGTARKITTDFKQILRSRLTNEDDQSRRFNVMAYSTARLKLLRKKNKHKVLDHEYFAFLYRILYPNTRIWTIGDRLQLAPSLQVDNKLRRSKDNSIKDRFKKLQAIAGRCIYRARYTCFHAERGSFPNYSKAPNWDESIPFYEQEHENFKFETYEGDGADRNHTCSSWQHFLKQTHLDELKDYVTKINKFYVNYKTNSEEYAEQLELFLQGKDTLKRPTSEQIRMNPQAGYELTYR